MSDTKQELFHKQGRLMFGQVREDAAVDLFLVNQLQSPSRLFVVASGGCTALSLLSVGSCSIDALDISQAQIALVELKAKLFKHLGYATAKQACISEARNYCAQVNVHLSPPAAQYFSAHRESIKNGLNNCGWVDSRMHQLTKLFYLFVHSIEETKLFLGLDDVAEQRIYFKERWCNWQWKLAMKIAFSKLFLTLAHGRAAEKLVPDDFSKIMEARLVRVFTDFSNATNPYLWQAFFAQYNTSNAALPPYLQDEYGPLIEANIANLNLVCEDTIAWLEKQPARSIDYFGLSNILELLPPEYAAKLQDQIGRCGCPGAIVCVRSIFKRRTAVFDTNVESCGLVFDGTLSDRAEKIDRSLFCNFYEIYRCV